MLADRASAWEVVRPVAGMSTQVPEPSSWYCQTPCKAVALLPATSTPAKLAPLSTSAKRPPSKVAMDVAVLSVLSSTCASSAALDDRVGRSFWPVMAMVTACELPPAVVT